MTFKGPFQPTSFYDSIIWTLYWGSILFLLENYFHAGNMGSDKYSFTLLLLQFWLHGRCQIHSVEPSIFSVETEILTCESCSLPDGHDHVKCIKIAATMESAKISIILSRRIWSVINPISSQVRAASRPPVDFRVCVTVKPSNFSLILHLARSLGFLLQDAGLITGLYLLSVMHSAAFQNLTETASMLHSSFN